MTRWQPDDDGAARAGGGVTRRGFMRNSAGALAALSGSGLLMAACGGDDEQASGSGTGSSDSGKGTKTVQVVNILPPQLGYTAEYIAALNGHFKKEGISVKVGTARGSAPAIQAILSGTAMLSWVGWLESVTAIADQGAPITSVAFTGRRSPLAIVSHKDRPLNDPKALVGKRIGIPSEGGTSETTLDLLLASNDIEPREVPRQVTGFTPGTFTLVERERIAGFIIGASQTQQFREAQPDAVFLPTEDHVTDGLNYITSKKGLESNREQVEAYLRALKASMEQILDDKDTGFATTIKTLRGEYDFPELEKDSVAKAYIDYISTSWLMEGQENLLKTDPEKWQATYDAAVKVKAAKAGKDVTGSVDGVLT
jgi:NitT/TauT family transport system substrate-binding protein